MSSFCKFSRGGARLMACHKNEIFARGAGIFFVRALVSGWRAKKQRERISGWQVLVLILSGTLAAACRVAHHARWVTKRRSFLTIE